MRPIAPTLILLVATSVAGAAPAPDTTAAPSNPAVSPPSAANANDALLRSAWVWEARRRGDLARQSLEKLLRARPGDMRVMLEIGLVDLRSGRFNDAKRMLDTMRAKAPKDAATRELETAHRVATHDRLQLASLNRLLELERFDEAALVRQKLFPDGPPGHTLGIDYYRAIARTPGGWLTARAGFEKLIVDNPTDPRYRLALANHLTLNTDTRVAGLNMLAGLSGRDDIRQDEVMAAWRRGLERSSAGQATPTMLKLYAQHAKDDIDAQAWAAAGHLPGKQISSQTSQSDSVKAPERVDPKAKERERQLRTLLVDGERQLKEGEASLALIRFEKANRLAPDAAAPLNGQLRALIDLKRVEDAEALLSRNKLDAATSARLRADLLRAQSDQAQAAGQTGQALSLLERAQELVPADPWMRFALARLYAKLGLARQGRELMDEGLQRAPRDVDTRYASALYLSSMDEDGRAMNLLSSIAPAQRTQGMRDLRERLELRQATARALQLHAEHQQAAAVQQLEALSASVAGKPEQRQDWIQAWADIGETDRALALISASPAASAADPRLLLLRLRILDKAQRDRELLAAVDVVPTQRLDADGLRELQNRRVNALRRLASAQQKQGDNQTALALIDAALAHTPDQRSLRLLRAELLADAGRWKEAGKAYQQLLSEPAVEPELRLAAAQVMEHNGQSLAAREQVDKVLATVPADALDLRLSAARRLRAQNDLAAAQRELKPLLADYPQSAALREEAGWLARSQADYGQAVQQFRAAQALRPGDAGLTPIIQSIEARRTGLLSAGVDFEDRPGDPGLSDTRQWTMPVELRWPYRYDGHFVAQVDTVRIEAGRLPGNYADAALYGSVQAAGPASVLGFADGIEQQDSGVALGVGYENDRWRVDIGTTPIGFATETVVGGLRYSMPLAALDLMFEVSRRAVTSSLVAYAGAEDPVSGRIWGGVHQNGGRTRLAYYGPRFSASLTGEAALFEGKNVPDNRYFGARAASDYALYARNAQRLTLGLAATYWDYQRNQRYYSFGHGGYYSPQSYLNLSVPLEWRGRLGRISYELRAAVSHSNTRENATAFYPDDPGLQAQAALSPLPPGYQEPVYSGSSGGAGWGRSLQARVEAPVFGPWTVGLRAGLDRSDYYEPNFYTLYLRRSLSSGESSGSEVTALPPRPPRVYSQY